MLEFGLYAIGLFLVLAAISVLNKLRQIPIQKAADERAREDYTNMLILLQTMRDVLESQRDLARDLNAALDKKVLFIKEMVGSAKMDMHDLSQRMADLAKQVEALEAEPLERPEISPETL